MNHKDFDQLVEAVRGDVPDSSAAADRVRTRLGEVRIGGETLCDSFRADGVRSEARQMLWEDHLRSCVFCRREASGYRAQVVQMPRRVPRWIAPAMAAALMAGVLWAGMPVLDRVLAPAGARASVALVAGTLVAIAADGASPLAVGAEIAEGREIRTGKGSRAVLRLRDGSLVEMDERSAVTLAELWRGKTVRLVRGNVIVEAAKQRSGYLQVATADALVSVKGTIFGVSTGLKGSRVSVVEGEVRVDQGGQAALLYRGDQKVTNAAMGAMAVIDDVAWSTNAAKYIALLADLKDVHERISRIPLPGLRYSSTLLDRVPLDSVVVAVMPNLGAVMSEATRIFEDKARESAAMKEWWTASGGAEMRTFVDRARAVSDFLGEEIVVAIPKQGMPVMLAEVRKPGLAEELKRLGFPGAVSMDGGVVAVGSAAVPPVGGFGSTAMGTRVRESYRAGVGLLFAANLEQIAAASVNSSVVGLDNLRFLIAEQKGTLAAPVHSASLNFNGARHGVVSWLAAPGPMGSLEFISKDATFAGSFLMRDPRQMLEELRALSGTGSAADKTIMDDAASSLGGEATIAFDGALLPTPAWIVAAELEDGPRLQSAIERVIPTVKKEVVDGRTYYSITETPMPVHYTFVDGYWLLGSSRAQLMRAISNRSAGLTLSRSNEFRAQMPQDGHTYFSGLMYYNFGSTLGPIVDQLKSTGMLSPQTQAQADTLMTNRAPSLIYVYGEPDRIQVGSRSTLFSMGLQALMSGNPLMGLPIPSVGKAQ